MIRVEPTPDVSVRAPGGAGKQQGTSDDLFAALLALIGGITAPTQPVLSETATGGPGGDPADADPTAVGRVTTTAGATAAAVDAGTGSPGRPAREPLDAKDAPKPRVVPLPPDPSPVAGSDTPGAVRSKPTDQPSGDHPSAPVAAAAHAAPAQPPDPMPAAATPLIAAPSVAQDVNEAHGSQPTAPTSYVSQLPEVVTDAAARLRPSGDGARLSVRLDPPAVGTVLISLHVVDDHVRLMMHAPDGGGAEALQHQRHLVEAALSAEGLHLDDFRVDVGTGWTGTPADSSPDGQPDQMRSGRPVPQQSASFAGEAAPAVGNVQQPGVWL